MVQHLIHSNKNSLAKIELNVEVDGKQTTLDGNPRALDCTRTHAITVKNGTFDEDKWNFLIEHEFLLFACNYEYFFKKKCSFIFVSHTGILDQLKIVVVIVKPLMSGKDWH